MNSVKNGDNVSVHYVGKLEDGTVFDSSHYNGMTLNFQVGSGNVIDGFDDSLVGMTTGEKKTVVIPFERAYGPRVEQAVVEVQRNFFPEDFEFIEGAIVKGTTEEGQEMLAKLVTKTDEGYVLDFNHPLAGCNLTFEIDLVSVD